MRGSQAEKYTAQFYEWEQRARGWILAPFPIDLEPPHHPFFCFDEELHHIDDGKRPSLYSKLRAALSDTIATQTQSNPDYRSIDLFPYDNSSRLYTFKIIAPSHPKSTSVLSEQLLLMFSYCLEPISFEIIGTSVEVVFQVACREDDAPFIKTQLRAYLPDHTILEQHNGDKLANTFSSSFSCLEYGLSEEFIRPLALYGKSTTEPYLGIFGILDSLEPEEQAVLQFLFIGTRNEWAKTITHAVTNSDGSSFFADAPEMPALAKEKVSAPLFATCVRSVVSAHSSPRCSQIQSMLSNAIISSTRSPYNSFIPLENLSEINHIQAESIINRTSYRMGMLLNLKEMATLVHIPSVRMGKQSTLSQSKAAPNLGSGIVLGTNIHNGIEQLVNVSYAQRLKHTHIIGATGTGKSTLLLNLISQDILSGEGIAVIDPHGDLIERVLKAIPESRIQDIVLIDPTDTEYPLPLNVLKANTELEKEILASDLVVAFKRYATSWGDQMHSVLANAILVFLESSRGGTLIDLKRFLLEKEFRETILKTVADQDIQYYWHKQYPLLKSNSVGPILTRLDTFLRPKIIRNMLGQKSCLDFEGLLNSKKIILLKLSHGLLGEENSFLLGSLVLAKIHQAAVARQSQEQSSRNNFFVYIDEFHNFITPSLSAMLSGARKYHVGLVVCHQDLQQLNRADDISSAVLSNTGTRICFRVGDADARILEKGFQTFDAEALTNLGTGEAICRVDKSSQDFNLTVTNPAGINMSNYSRDDIVKSSRELYASHVGPILPHTPEYRDDPISSSPDTKALKKEISPSMDDLNKAKEVSQHRYLQMLTKKIAEGKGFHAAIEVPTPDGSGRVDVLITAGPITIACEISVTTEATWEMHNLQKCIAAGYDQVVLCTSSTRTKAAVLSLIRDTYSNTDKIHVLEPEDLFHYINSFGEQKEVKTNSEQRVKGYRVKVQYNDVTTNASTGKRQSITKVVMDALKRSGNNS